MESSNSAFFKSAFDSAINHFNLVSNENSIFLGVVHDATDSYIGALHFTSFLSFFCVLLWLISGLWTPGGKVLRLARRSTTEEQENSREIA